jgi:H+/Cl- antiporter ClcA
VGSILVSLVVGCFGVWGGQSGWGPMVAGAFAVLALFAGIASVVLGRLALTEHRRRFDSERPRGRGLALAGVICGASGLALTALAFLLAVSLTL